MLLSVFKSIAILVGLNWFLIMVLIFISLIIMMLKHLFTWPLMICIPSSEKYLFKFSAYLLTELFIILLLSCKNSLYILDTHPLSDIWFAIFLPFCGYVIHFSKPNTLYACLFKIITMPEKLTVDVIPFTFVFFSPFLFFPLKFSITILKLFNMWLSKTNLTLTFST